MAPLNFELNAPTHSTIKTMGSFLWSIYVLWDQEI